MQKGAIFAGLTALAVSLSSSLQAQTAETVIAKVGDVEITLGEMIIAHSQLPQQYAQLPANVLWDGILDQLIQQELLANTLEEVPFRTQLALRNERRSLYSGEVVNALMLNATTEEAIQEAYDKRFEGVEMGLEYNASHLLVETEEEALAALERVNSGEEFADVARDVSTGPTGPNGGNLGWFGPGQMVAPFEEAVEALEIGGVSGPVQTQFGWHIVTLNDTRNQEQPELEALRGELTREIQAAALDARIAELMDSAQIERPEDGAYDPEILKDLSILEPGAE